MRCQNHKIVTKSSNITFYDHKIHKRWKMVEMSKNPQNYNINCYTYNFDKWPHCTHLGQCDTLLQQFGILLWPRNSLLRTCENLMDNVCDTLLGPCETLLVTPYWDYVTPPGSGDSLLRSHVPLLGSTSCDIVIPFWNTWNPTESTWHPHWITYNPSETKPQPPLTR